MRTIKVIVAAAVLVGISSSALAWKLPPLRTNTPKDDNACMVYEGGQICN